MPTRPRRYESQADTPAEDPLNRSRVGVTIIGTQVDLQLYYGKNKEYAVLSVYHNDYRHVWIQINNPANYVHQRAQGQHPEDKTCYYEPHRSWGENRNTWPDVAFQYKPARRTSNADTPPWFFTEEGWLVLDFRHRPVLDFDMPQTLSSACEGFIMECILRENHEYLMGVQDLQARMPGMIVNGKEPNRVGTLSMRMTRFRLKAGCISWNPKVDSIAVEAYMDMKLPDACKIANSTRGFRSLHPHEIAEIHVINAGQRPNKARHGRKDFSDTHQNIKLQEAIDAAVSAKADFDSERNTRLSLRGSCTNTYQLAKNPTLASEKEYTEYLHLLPALRDTRGWSNGADNSPPNTPLEQSPSPDAVAGPSSSNSIALQPPRSLVPQHPSFLNAMPRKRSHFRLMSLLLAPTVYNYECLTGIPPPATNPRDSYQDQLDDLRNAFAQLLADYQSDIDYTGLELVQLVEWTWEGLEWNWAWSEQAFGPMPEWPTVLDLIEGL